jgi:hypothetical protein
MLFVRPTIIIKAGDKQFEKYPGLTKRSFVLNLYLKSIEEKIFNPKDEEEKISR